MVFEPCLGLLAGTPTPIHLAPQSKAGLREQEKHNFQLTKFTNPNIRNVSNCNLQIERLKLFGLSVDGETPSISLAREKHVATLVLAQLFMRVPWHIKTFSNSEASQIQLGRPGAPSWYIQPVGLSSGLGMLGGDSTSSHGGGPKAKLCQ